MLRPQPIDYEELELGPMIHQPIQVKEPLIDDVLVGRPLEFDNHRTSVLIKSQSIDPTAMPNACRKLACEETDTQKALEIALDQGLQGLLENRRLAGKLLRGAAPQAEKLDVAHEVSSSSAL